MFGNASDLPAGLFFGLLMILGAVLLVLVAVRVLMGGVRRGDVDEPVRPRGRPNVKPRSCGRSATNAADRP